MTSFLHLVIIVICSTLPTVTRCDDAFFSPKVTSSLVQFIENLMQCRGVTGLSVAVVRGNETWSQGFGVADRESGRKVKSSTLFGIASLTKSFTAALLSLYLNETSGLTWDTRVADILGEDFRFATELLTSHVTLRDLLTHRTGLLNSNIPVFAGLPDSMTSEDFARRLRHLPVKSSFRDAWDYNNYMYSLLGRVLEVLGGASWEDLLSARILTPLGMTDTRVLGRTVGVEADNFAKPYVILRDEVILSDPDVYCISPQEAAGAMASSADDMTKWLRLLLNKGRNPDGASILKDTRIAEMMKPHITVPVRLGVNLQKPDFPAAFLAYGYGYAWFSAVYRGYDVKWHSGGLHAYLSYQAVVPGSDVGVFIATNGPGNQWVATQQLLYHLLDVALGLEPWQDVSNACQFPDHWLNSGSDTSSNSSGDGRPQTRGSGNDTTVELVTGGQFDKVERFEGRYGHLLYGNLDVTCSADGGLRASLNLLRGTLLTTAQEGVTLMDVDGPVAFLTHRTANFTLYFNLTFTQPSGSRSGEFQALEVSAPRMNELIPLVFRRDVDYYADPSDEK